MRLLILCLLLCGCCNCSSNRDEIRELQQHVKKLQEDQEWYTPIVQFHDLSRQVESLNKKVFIDNNHE